VAVTVYFDYGSPYAYLAWQRITHVHADRYRAVEVAWKPVSAGHIFKADHTAPNVTMPNQRRYLLEDVQRWADAYGVPFAPPPFGTPGEMPVNAIQALRLHFVAADAGLAGAWMQAVFLGYFRDGLDISDAGVVARLASAVGLPGGVAAAAAPGVKQRLIANTEEAYAAGAPGVPYTVLDGENYWGNDRLAWVEARLAGGAVTA